jgi:hemerythrin
LVDAAIAAAAGPHLEVSPMSLIVWGQNLEVGVAMIDAQHRELVAIVNRLSDAMAAGKGKAVVGVILMELITYTQKHFETEERLMREHAYVSAPSHQSEHRALVKRVSEFKAKFDSGAATLAISVLNFLCDWLKTHIQESDKKLGKYLVEQGVK